MSATTALQLLALDSIQESAWNPRTIFDPAKVESLARSLKEHGQLDPVLVRPLASGKFELAAGHRRLRAARQAGLKTLEAKVRELTDEQFVEILTIENDEREDLHPLEQAEGYRLLMTKCGYDVAKIADRVQRSHDFVYDRLRLLQLTPELKKLFLEARFQLAHALILAKLSPEEQAKVSKTSRDRWDGDRGGLWRSEGATLDDKAFGYVPKSPAELEYWIATELRFEPDQVELEEIFPETAIALQNAEETGTKVVSVTHDTYIRPEARSSSDRTFLEGYWKRADGLEGSKECEYAAVGVIRTGEGRGEAMGVCIRRDKCKVHWPTEVRAAEAKANAAKKGSKGTPAAKAKRENAKLAAEARARKAAAVRKLAESRAAVAAVAIEAALEAVVKQPTKAAVSRAREILGGKGGAKLSLEQILVDVAVEQEFRGNLNWQLTDPYHKPKTLKKLKGWGIDGAKILAEVKVVTCNYCGCSEENACQLGKWGGGPSCKWVSQDPPVCSNPACVAASKGQKAPAAASAEDAGDDEDFEE